MIRSRIHLSVPHMGGLEEGYVAEAFRTNWMSTVGPNIDRFEQEMAARLGGGRHTLAVSSGTAALHLVLRDIGVGPGDRVAVATLTFAGSVFPILYLGATPVFLDSEERSGNIDPVMVDTYFRAAAKRGELPKALIAVHLYGQHADLDPLAELCGAYGVTLVEDAAESLGSTYRGRETATTAPYAILSFNGNKIITTSGGGMVVASDAAALERMKKWANQAREPALEYLHAELGYNYRMSNVLAGIGRGQLQVLGARVAARQRVAQRYAEALRELPGVALQPEAPWGTHSRWLSVILLDKEECPVRPAQLIADLDEANIEGRPVWRPMHTQPLFSGAARVGGEIAESLYARGVCLPSSSNLTTDEQDRVIAVLRTSIGSPALIRSR
jgi:dTDP-4-amino-4,6-dideoxygalactose transaminase